MSKMYTYITPMKKGKDVDLSNYATKQEIPTKLSQLTNDKGYLTEHQDLSDYAKKVELHSHSNKSVLDGITNAKVTEWNNKSTFSGSYTDLTNKPVIPSSLPANGGNSDTVNGLSLWVGSQEEYDEIATKSNTTIYIIKE